MLPGTWRAPPMIKMRKKEVRILSVEGVSDEVDEFRFGFELEVEAVSSFVKMVGEGRFP